MIKRSRFAAAAALLAVFVMLFSILFVAVEADHDCSGDDCVICVRIQACENFLRNLLPAEVLLITAWFFCAQIQVLAGSDCCFVCPITLIVLKVKLSD